MLILSDDEKKKVKINCNPNTQRKLCTANILMYFLSITFTKLESYTIYNFVACFFHLQYHEHFSVTLINLFYLFYFWLHWVFLAACRFSLVVVSGGYSSWCCAGFSLQWLLLLWSTGSRCAGFSSCGSRALEHRLSSCGAWAQLLHGMWDLLEPGLKPVSPALAGRFLTTAPPGKPSVTLNILYVFNAFLSVGIQHVFRVFFCFLML